MLSEFAMQDIAALEAEGIRLAPAEIVRLNALALRVENASASADVLAAPRIGWAGDTAVHEPSAAAEEWMDTVAARFAADTDAYWSMLLFACAHAVVPGFFRRPELQTPAGISAAMSAWRMTLSATPAQLKTALRHALYGDDAAAGETPAPRADLPADAARPGTPRDHRMDIIDSALSAALGIPPADLELMSTSRIVNILRRYMRNQGCDLKDSRLKAHADYIRTRLEIRKAHSAPSAAQPQPQGEPSHG